jgi:hypothetical protein
VIIVLARHLYTVETFAKDAPFDLKVRPYAWALRATRLPRATYIFTDFDRMSPWELELAARLRIVLKNAGMTTLNDPARALQRCAMLRALHARGQNDFKVWRPEDGEEPDAFPVFLRTQAAHRGTLSDLLETPEAAASALSKALDEGYALKDLMFVQYCAEELRPGLFRKLAAFRVGPTMVSALCVHDAHWSAKYGSLGIAGQELYDDEADIVTANRYGEVLRPAFETAQIEYGRADFGLVGGRIQVYEINTNPDIRSIGEHPFLVRMQADKLFFERLHAAFATVDTPAGGRPAKLDDPVFTKQRRREYLSLRERLVV